MHCRDRGDVFVYVSDALYENRTNVRDITNLPAMLNRRKYAGKVAWFACQYQVIKANMPGFPNIRAKLPENQANIKLYGQICLIINS